MHCWQQRPGNKKAVNPVNGNAQSAGLVNEPLRVVNTDAHPLQKLVTS